MAFDKVHGALQLLVILGGGKDRRSDSESLREVNAAGVVASGTSHSCACHLWSLRVEEVVGPAPRCGDTEEENGGRLRTACPFCPSSPLAHTLPVPHSHQGSAQVCWLLRGTL